MDKFVCFFCGALYFGSFLGNFIYVYQFRNDQSLPIFLGNLSNFSLSMMVVYGVVLFHSKRGPLSHVIRDLNGKNWVMLERSNSIEYRSERNRIHLICIGTYLIGTILGCTTGPALFFKYLATGENHFDNHFTADKPPYSLWSFFNCFLNIFLVTWDISFYTPIFTIIMEIFLVISLNFRALAADLKDMSVEAAEELIFKRLMKDLQELQRFFNFFLFHDLLITQPSCF